MMNNAAEQVAALHAAYQELALEVRLTPEWERRWLEYIKQGYTVEDLRLVVPWLKRQIKRGQRHPNCIMLRNLLDYGPDGQFSRLDEDLAMARREWRPRRRPPAEPPAPPRPQATPEQRRQWAEQLRAKRDQLR